MTWWQQDIMAFLSTINITIPSLEEGIWWTIFFSILFFLIDCLIDLIIDFSLLFLFLIFEGKGSKRWVLVRFFVTAFILTANMFINWLINYLVDKPALFTCSKKICVFSLPLCDYDAEKPEWMISCRNNNQAPCYLGSIISIILPKLLVCLSSWCHQVLRPDSLDSACQDVNAPQTTPELLDQRKSFCM